MNSNDVVRKQWNQAAESFSTFVRTGRNCYCDYMNAPALRRMVGNVKGKRMLDIGCGEGFFCRFFARAGNKVTGVDISDRLIEKAVEMEQSAPLGVEYVAADAANLSMLNSESFDIVYSHMALMDIANFRGAIAEASRVLKLSGRLVVIIEHPCFEAYRTLNGTEVSGWKKENRKKQTVEHEYFWVKDYKTKHSYLWEWKTDRLPSSFVTTGFHRTLSDYINTMTKNQLVITNLDEPRPLKQGVKLAPNMKKHNRIPQSIAIEARKVTHRPSSY
jgi:ubiquinone/menaquinone biosynthesis C-methylase UbiE